MKVSPKLSRISCLIVAGIFALPLSWGYMTGLFLWTSPLLFLETTLARHVVSLWAVLGVLSLGFISIRHRWYCRWLCPTGLLCDAISHTSRGTSVSRFPRIGPGLAVVSLMAAATGVPLLGMLDPIVIFHSFWDGCRLQVLWLAVFKMAGLLVIVGINGFIPGFWCGKLCPLGGLQDMVARLRQVLSNRSKSSLSFLPSRRMTLAAGAGIGFGLIMRKNSDHKSHPIPIRPPGALPGDAFSTTCIRCGNCGKACPTDIIKASFDVSDWAGLLTPTLSFASGYCLPECTACAQVCPSGAIKRFSREDKKTLFLGSAHIQREHCLLAEQKECDRCQFYCEYDAITIHSSDIDFSAWPEVHRDRCVGCGACAAVCPASVITVEGWVRTGLLQSSRTQVPRRKPSYEFNMASMYTST